MPAAAPAHESCHYCNSLIDSRERILGICIVLYSTLPSSTTTLYCIALYCNPLHCTLLYHAISLNTNMCIFVCLRVICLGLLGGKDATINIHENTLKHFLGPPSNFNWLPIKIISRAPWMGNIWKLWRSLGKSFWGNDTIHTCAATYPHLTWASMGYWLYYFSILSPQGIP